MIMHTMLAQRPSTRTAFDTADPNNTVKCHTLPTHSHRTCPTRHNQFQPKTRPDPRHDEGPLQQRTAGNQPIAPCSIYIYPRQDRRLPLQKQQEIPADYLSCMVAIISSQPSLCMPDIAHMAFAGSEDLGWACLCRFLRIGLTKRQTLLWNQSHIIKP